MVSAYEKTLDKIKPLTPDKLFEAVEILQTESLQTFLKYCTEQSCFTERESYTIFDNLVEYEDKDSSFFEEKNDQMLTLCEKIGLTEEVFEQYLKEVNM